MSSAFFVTREIVFLLGSELLFFRAPRWCGGAARKQPS